MLTRDEFLIALLALSWVGGFLPLWLRKGDWRWWQCVGLALVISPFVRGLLNILNSLDVLISTTDALQAIPRRALYDMAWLSARNNLVIPGIGLLLMFNAPPSGLPGVLRRLGLGPRFSVSRDTAHGFALFLALMLTYVGAILLLHSAPALQADGDESQVWKNVTPDIVLLLALASGIGEEFVYRGLLLTQLARVMPWWPAAVAQAAFFGFVHAGYGTWIHVIGPALFGLGMAVVVRALGIVPAMVLHVSINTTIFAMEAARVRPEAWLIVLGLVVLNAYAAWRVRLDPFRRVLAVVAGRDVPAPTNVTVAAAEAEREAPAALSPLENERT